MRRLFGKLIFARAMPVKAQSVVQRLIGGPRLETIRFQSGHLFDCLTSEKYYWLRDSFEGEVRRELEACLRPNSVLFDIGANAGFWEVMLASKCRHIHAFEPSPVNFARLSRNVAQNKIKNVTTVAAAVSHKTAKVRFFDNGSMSQVSDAGGIEVEAITLDNYIAQHEPPTVVKIDIEGHAGMALAGMRSTLLESKPVLFVELHDTCEVAACQKALDGIEYSFSALESIARFPYRAQIQVV